MAQLRIYTESTLSIQKKFVMVLLFDKIEIIMNVIYYVVKKLYLTANEMKWNSFELSQNNYDYVLYI